MMGLEIINTTGISERDLVCKLIEEIKSNPRFFKFLARLFADYKSNDSSLINEIHIQIDKRLNSPRLKYSREKTNSLSQYIREIYYQDKKTFDVIRGEILENVVYHFGPFTKGLNKKLRYIEPVIKDKLIDGQEKIVGETGCKCDLVFFTEETIPLEFVECKADIGNVIPRTLPFRRAKKDHREKVLYLDNAYNYLSNNYCTPSIYFACYNLDYEVMLKNLQKNWGYNYMEFINAEEIIDGK